MHRQQQHPTTVGDTLTIVHRIAVRPGAVVQARPPADSSIATLVSAPVVTREGDSVQIAYTVAVWSAGQNDLALPGAIVVDQRGHVDTLPDAHVRIDVASLLPGGKATGVAPHAARPWLPRADQTNVPFLVLLPLVLVGIGIGFWRRRRRATPVAVAAPAAPAVDIERYGRWVAAGEARLALEHMAALVGTRPGFDAWREQVAAIRFAPGDDSAAAALVDEARRRMAESS